MSEMEKNSKVKREWWLTGKNGDRNLLLLLISLLILVIWGDVIFGFTWGEPAGVNKLVWIGLLIAGCYNLLLFYILMKK